MGGSCCVGVMWRVGNLGGGGGGQGPVCRVAYVRCSSCVSDLIWCGVQWATDMANVAGAGLCWAIVAPGECGGGANVSGGECRGELM